jgi:hypothetical protein
MTRKRKQTTQRFTEAISAAIPPSARRLFLKKILEAIQGKF